MKLVTYRRDGEERLGALSSRPEGEMILDLNRADPRLPATMIAFIAAGDEALRLAREAIEAAPSAAWLPRAAVTLQAPIPAPGKIICIGRNYAEHAAETNSEVPKYPIIFAKFANTVNDPGAPIVLPGISDEIDYEGELAVVIGRRARSVPEADALHYVGGYMPFDDVSARDLQFLTGQWTIGKTLDTFAPMGPALVTADEVPDPQNLNLRTIVSGEVLQSDNTRNMIFPVAHLIAYLSGIFTLEPGDVIATGTPSGVGLGRVPPRYLKAGDVVRIEIEGIGVLENPVVGPTRTIAGIRTGRERPPSVDQVIILCQTQIS